MGFEPTVSCPTHAFQACRFGRSRIPPEGGHRTGQPRAYRRIRPGATLRAAPPRGASGRGRGRWRRRPWRGRRPGAARTQSSRIGARSNASSSAGVMLSRPGSASVAVLFSLSSWPGTRARPSRGSASPRRGRRRGRRPGRRGARGPSAAPDGRVVAGRAGDPGSSRRRARARRPAARRRRARRCASSAAHCRWWASAVTTSSPTTRSSSTAQQLVDRAERLRATRAKRTRRPVSQPRDGPRASGYGDTADRARRGARGALYPQSTFGGLNPRPRPGTPHVGLARRCRGSGPAQRNPANRVRSGRKQLSADRPVCRRLA